MSRYGAKRFQLPRKKSSQQKVRAFIKKPFCAYCGVSLTLDADRTNTCTVDHIVPKSLGGSGYSWNKTLACLGCNRAKSDSGVWVLPAFTFYEVLGAPHNNHVHAWALLKVLNRKVVSYE